MCNYTAGLVLVAYEPPRPKSTLLTVLLPGLLVLLTVSPLIPPVHSRQHVSAKMSRFEALLPHRQPRLTFGEMLLPVLH
jgi:hypothetical protein